MPPTTRLFRQKAASPINTKRTQSPGSLKCSAGAATIIHGLRKARNEAKILLEKLKQQKKYLGIKDEVLAILGPNPGFVARENGKYKWNIVLKSKIEDLKLRNRLLIIASPYWDIEVDPESLL